MNSKFMKTGIVAATLAAAILIPSGQVSAADTTFRLEVPKQNRIVEFEQNALINVIAEISEDTEFEKEIKIESTEEIQLNSMLSGKAFAVIEDADYLLVQADADENSDWVGKIFKDSALVVVERAEEWTKIVSGNVEGFIKTENLIFGKDAIEKAKEILSEKHPETELTTLDQETIDNSFSVGETKEEEAERIAAEEAAKKAAEEARIAAEREALRAKGQSVVNYATQFIGNPYVWGGTSLTNGTDCSGFVKSVYAHFGVYMPRTSTAMRSVGRAVSYSEMLPGDIICYSGHVGIYAGNGQIVNAIDSAHGIGMSSATYANIITIRRMF